MHEEVVRSWLEQERTLPSTQMFQMKIEKDVTYTYIYIYIYIYIYSKTTVYSELTNTGLHLTQSEGYKHTCRVHCNSPSPNMASVTNMPIRKRNK